MLVTGVLKFSQCKAGVTGVCVMLFIGVLKFSQCKEGVTGVCVMLFIGGSAVEG